MHKYWGKKPSDELKKILEKYTRKKDVVFDPFSGYGGIAIESLLLNRNVIINDLNPIATFISKTILCEEIDLQKVKALFLEIKKKYRRFENEWYTYKGFEVLTILRTKTDIPVKIKIKSGKSVKEIILTEDEINFLLEQENNYSIDTWYPTDTLIPNSRIGAKAGMRVCDLFSKRSLICQSYLNSIINELDNSPEKSLLLLAFTANLANCSKLVPPITSRGDMAQGAWMTGFYVGETYLENNVFHYFENRVQKAIKGKEIYLQGRLEANVSTTYTVLNEDSKKLSLKSDSVDFVFTDFPYGDTVPYFEQSQLWNSWLQFSVDFENEIVVSDSNQRRKNTVAFKNDIISAISEIKRILKPGSYFVFTFHSLNGSEWEAIYTALEASAFEFVDCDIILQKTLPPRQLNRNNTIKGDVVVTYRCSDNPTPSKNDFDKVIEDSLKGCKEELDTNDVVILFIKAMLCSFNAHDVDFAKLTNKYFSLNQETNKWRKKNDIHTT